MIEWVKALHWAGFGLFVLVAWLVVNVLIDQMIGQALTLNALVPHLVSGVLVALVFGYFRRRAQMGGGDGQNGRDE